MIPSSDCLQWSSDQPGPARKPRAQAPATPVDGTRSIKAVVHVEAPLNAWATRAVSAPTNWPREASERRAIALRRDGCRRRATETVESILKAERCIDRPGDDLINILVNELVNLG